MNSSVTVRHVPAPSRSTVPTCPEHRQSRKTRQSVSPLRWLKYSYRAVTLFGRNINNPWKSRNPLLFIYYYLAAFNAIMMDIGYVGIIRRMLLVLVLLYHTFLYIDSLRTSLFNFGRIRNCAKSCKVARANKSFAEWLNKNKYMTSLRCPLGL